MREKRRRKRENRERDDEKDGKRRVRVERQGLTVREESEPLPESGRVLVGRLARQKGAGTDVVLDKIVAVGRCGLANANRRDGSEEKGRPEHLPDGREGRPGDRHARTSLTNLPCTSVSRKSRPA